MMGGINKNPTFASKLAFLTKETVSCDVFTVYLKAIGCGI